MSCQRHVVLLSPRSGMTFFRTQEAATLGEIESKNLNDPTPTVDGRNPAPVEVGSLSHYLHGSIHPRLCRISSINSSQKTIVFLVADEGLN